jgi:nucleotide-binding universal stress UspA family protein
MLKPTKILVPTDFSRYSNIALKQAVDIAEEYGAELHILHVVEMRIHTMYEYEFAGKEASPEGIKDLEGKRVRIAEGKMIEFTGQIGSGKQLKVFPRVMKGEPITEILRYQKERGIDLIVISSLGHTGLAEYFTGSVARNVLKGATCPVLLTKG